MNYDRFRQAGMVLLCGSLMAFGVSPVTAQAPDGREENVGRRSGPPRFELGQMFPPSLLEELELSPKQKQELDAISKDLKAKLEKLLTAEQKQRVENFRPRGPQGDGSPEGRRPASSPQSGKDSERPDSTSPAETVQPLQAKLKELPKGVTRTPVVFSGGYDTDPRDHGRPVVLIAAALGVTPEVFREAFSRVRPAAGGREPEPAQVRQNKAVLMEALGKHGITNERLDEVSNFYRYPPGRNSMWNHKPAVANALIKDGSIIGYEIISGGSGYTSKPTVLVPKIKGVPAEVEISYGKAIESNGNVTAISVPSEKGSF